MMVIVTSDWFLKRLRPVIRDEKGPWRKKNADRVKKIRKKGGVLVMEQGPLELWAKRNAFTPARKLKRIRH